jgi:hypothetical protein
MRSISVRSFHKWGFALAVLASSTLPALAQESKGEFTIPREVHWGTLVLPAGTYDYSVEHHASEVLLLRPKAGGGGHFLLANAVSRPEEITPNRLILERRGAAWYVTSMVVNDFGEVLKFPAPAESTLEPRTKLATVASK